MATKTVYDYSYPTGLAPLPDMDVADWLGPVPERRLLLIEPRAQRQHDVVPQFHHAMIGAGYEGLSRSHR